jgi:hypothetical protein
MKPLQMLDHVMLWVARFYAVFLVISNFAQLVLHSSDPDRVVITHFCGANAPGFTGTELISTGYYHGPTTDLATQVLLYSCIAAGLLIIYRKFARKLVISAATISIGIGIYGVLRLAYLIAFSSSPGLAGLSDSSFLKIISGCALHTIVQAGNIWLVLRFPVSAGKSGDADHPPFMSMQPL